MFEHVFQGRHIMLFKGLSVVCGLHRERSFFDALLSRLDLAKSVSEIGVNHDYY